MMRNALEILLVTEGLISIAQASGCKFFNPGNTILIPAALADYELTAHTHAELSFATIPD